ncbi:MAG: ATP-binding cassette domain-containing protein, partial [Bilophila sp.]
LLTFTDLHPFTKRLAGKLSGGMKQKLGLACALLTTPRLLLLDEPGVGVDPLSRRELWRMVAGLAGDGMSVLWSTAYMDEAERCAHVLMLDQGKLVYQGPPATFIRRVAGRVFCLVPPQGEARATLALWQQQPGVRDALIQGSRIRLVLEHADTSRLTNPHLAIASLFPVPPRLEDAYIDAVGGMDLRPSSFAENGSPALSTSDAAAPLIRAAGLTKVFGTFVAAKDISFEVLPGRIFGLLGPNGAGKSTTFRMLCGLSRPTQGACFVAGMNLLTAAGAARARLGYMAQKFSLYGDLTVMQNLRLMADLYDLPREQVHKRLEEQVETLDLTAFCKVKANLLPLGHKQRLAMACATLHKPAVLFLDEPTSGVDPRTRREFWKHINAMTRNGVAVLVTTHFMEEAEYCDEIALVFQGAIIARGTPDELKAHCPLAKKPTPAHGAVTSTPDITLEEAFIAYIEQVNQKDNGAA